MYKFSRYFLPVAILAVTIMFWSCKEASPTEGDKAETQASDAYAELENQMYVMATSSIHGTGDLDNINFTTANSLYKQALAADQNNVAANFGAGLTEIYMIYADTVIKNAIKQWENSINDNSSFLNFRIPSGTKDMAVPTQALAKNMVKIIQTAVVDPPLIGEMQNIMRDQLLPHINYTLARLAVVELDPNFQFKISGKMQGNIHESPVYLDNTEVYIMDGVLHGLKAMVEQFLVYKFELSAYNSQALVQALQPSNTSFFYLATDGVARSQSVLADISGAVDKFQSAINNLKSETDDQSDDIIKIGHDGIQANDLDTTLVYLARAKQALLSTPQSFLINNANTDGDDYTIQVNIANFFNNPPTNPKTELLPSYTVSAVDASTHSRINFNWQAQDYASFTFPSTFTGLFISIKNENTGNIDKNENLKRLFCIDIDFSWQVDLYLHDSYYMWGSLPSSTTAKLVINGKTYNPQIRPFDNDNSEWWWWGRELSFFVMDNADQPVQVVANISSIDVPLILNHAVVVKLKDQQYIDGNLTLALQNITGSSSYEWGPNGYQYCALLNFNGYQIYKIEKDSTSSSFSVIDSTNSNYYYDYKVSRGKTYHYRACMTFPSYLGDVGTNAYAIRPNNYTNTVTVTIPQ